MTEIPAAKAASDSSILWGYQIHRPDEHVDQTIRDAVEQVAGNTDLPIYDGAPEAK